MTEIIYSNGKFSVREEQYGSGRFKPKSEGYSVYQDETVAATRVASYSPKNPLTLHKAIEDADRRAAA